MHYASAASLRHARANFFVEAVIRILGPPVELKVQSEQSGMCGIGGRRQENAAGIARPDAIGAPAVEADSLGERVGKRICFFEHRPRTLFRTRVIDDQVDALMPGQVADDFGIDPRDRVELTRPVAAKMRPGEPCGFMRLPFGGHVVSLCGG